MLSLEKFESLSARPSDSRNGLQRLKKESKQRSKLRAKMEQSTIPLRKGK